MLEKAKDGRIQCILNYILNEAQGYTISETIFRLYSRDIVYPVQYLECILRCIPGIHKEYKGNTVAILGMQQEYSRNTTGIYIVITNVSLFDIKC